MGNGAVPGAPHGRTRPRAPGRWLFQRPPAPERAAGRAVKGVRHLRPHDDPALGLPSTGRQAARSSGRFAPERRSPAKGKRSRAPRASPGHAQPCGSRTRRSCCNQSQDRPIVLARTGCSAPVRATGPVLALGPVALSCLRTSPEKRATRSRAEGG